MMAMVASKRSSLTLNQCWLYSIASKKDLARRLSTKSLRLTELDLENLSSGKDNYKLFTLEQDGKKRPIQEPKPILQKIHLRIHKLLTRIEMPDYMHSAVKRKSYITNAQSHRVDQQTCKIDIKKFFPSVEWVHIFNFFSTKLCCRSDVSGLLADLLTFNKRLPTGSCASQTIAYFSFKEMFDEIYLVSKQNELEMTCYVDDMTFTGPKANGEFIYNIHKIISKYGLKSHKMHNFSANQPKVITGVCRTRKGDRVPNKLQRAISIGFEEAAAQTQTAEVKKKIRSQQGRLEAASQIDPLFKPKAITFRNSQPKL